MIDQVGAIHKHWLEVIQTAIVFTVLTTVAVRLRFWTKSTTKAGFGADDVLIGISLLLFYGLAGVEIHGMFHLSITIYLLKRRTRLT